MVVFNLKNLAIKVFHTILYFSLGNRVHISFGIPKGSSVKQQERVGIVSVKIQIEKEQLHCV